MIFIVIIIYTLENSHLKFILLKSFGNTRSQVERGCAAPLNFERAKCSGGSVRASASYWCIISYHECEPRPFIRSISKNLETFYLYPELANHKYLITPRFF